jgi:hypothetical protein
MRFAVSRRIHVRVSPIGEITVEADGFQGKGCEAATAAIEEALGKPATFHEGECQDDFYEEKSAVMKIACAIFGYEDEDEEPCKIAAAVA